MDYRALTSRFLGKEALSAGACPLQVLALHRCSWRLPQVGTFSWGIYFGGYSLVSPPSTHTL